MVRIEWVNPDTCMLYLADELNPHSANVVRVATGLLQHQFSEQLVDLVPSYCSLMLCFSLGTFDRYQVNRQIRLALDKVSQQVLKPAKAQAINIPVYYGEEVGWDLVALSEHSGLPVEEVIERHHQCTYQVYAMGFSPGFAYLGEVDSQIAMPRKVSPRAKVPQGAVAIADRQTAVYPLQSPGGWQIIGRSPMTMLDWQSPQLSPLWVGARVHFQPICLSQYLELGGTLDEF